MVSAFFRLIRGAIVGIFYLMLLGICVLSTASFLGTYDFVCELLSHFRPLLCAATVIVTLCLALLGSRVGTAFGAIFCIVNAVPLLLLYLPQPVSEPEPGEARLRLLHMNLWGGRNQNYKAPLKLVRDTNPDVVGFSEITATWLTKLKANLKDYPYQVTNSAFGGVAVFSRVPMEGKIKYFEQIKRPRVEAKLMLGDQPVTLIFVHPVVPFRRVGNRNMELEEIAVDAKAAKANGPVIVAGDLNCTPWSPYFEKLKVDGQLIDTEQGFGIQPSWNAFWPYPLLPIDHSLASAEFVTTERHVGPRIGSDHLPVFTELVLNSKENMDLMNEIRKRVKSVTGALGL